MKLSVIVPVYNEETFLEECIRSILNQTKEDIELLLIDDGSTDLSGQICDEWAKRDKRIRVEHINHKGTLFARIEGIKASTATYITFIDADDFVNKESFAYADEYMNSDIDIICFGISRYHDRHYRGNEPCEYKNGFYNYDEIKKIILPTMIWNVQKGRPGMDPSLCIKIIKRDIIQNVAKTIKYVDLDIGDDMALSYQCIASARTLVVSKKIYYNHRIRNRDKMAPYVLKKDYFDKVFYLYKLLRESFSEDEKMMIQIEHFYIKLIEYRKKTWHEDSAYIKYLFPFDKVKKGSNVVLYGAGKVGMDYYRQLEKLSYCNEILVVDKDWKSISKEKVVSPDTINNDVIDYVVIAVLAKNVKEQITKELIGKGINKEKIITA